MASLGMLVGLGTVLVAGVALVGVATGVDISIGARGGGMAALPNTAGEALGLGGVGVGIAAASAGASWFTHRLGAASWSSRAFMVVAAVLVLGLGGRFVQLQVLVSVYGSMAAWYAAEGDVGALEAELATHPGADVLADVLFRGIQHDHPKVVGMALDHGARPVTTWDDGDTTCLLSDATKPVLAAAAKRGWGPDCARRASRR